MSGSQPGGTSRDGEAPPSRRTVRYQWLALSNTSMAVFMSAVDGSIVIISLPAIFRGIHLDPLGPGNIVYLLWMIMGYRLVQAVFVVTLGRLGDMYGRVRIYNAGFAVLRTCLDPAVLRALTAVRTGHCGSCGRRRCCGHGNHAHDQFERPSSPAPSRPREARLSAEAVDPDRGDLTGQFIGLLAGGLTTRRSTGGRSTG